MRSHILNIEHVSHGEAARGIHTLKRSTGVVRDFVLVDKFVGLQGITAIATTASDPVKEFKLELNLNKNIYL